MAVPDFSKIWASQSPLTPYEFSDEDYLDGWEFIGEIPPDRRMFDTWQKQTDTKAQWLYQNAAYLIRKDSTEYQKGDIAFSPNLVSSLVLECVSGGTTAATEPDFSDATVGATVEDGTVKWRYQPLIGGNMPLGAVAPFLQTSIPDGWLSLENGQLVLRSAYPELWAWVQDNAPLITDAEWQAKAAAQKSIGYYSDGDGSTTFRLPRIIGFVEGTTAANVGAFTGAGLPNIKGTLKLGFNSWWGGSTDGCFGGGATPDVPGAAPVAGTSTFNGPQFNASLSNSIYGASDTVQPESVGMVWCVRAFGAAVNQGTVDITELAQMLNLKLSISDAPRVCTPFAFPSDTYVTIPASGLSYSYTAPADGYIYYGCIVSGTTATNMAITNTTNGNQVSAAIPLGFTSEGICLPVKKGDTVVLDIQIAATLIAKFYYAVGEEP